MINKMTQELKEGREYNLNGVSGYLFLEEFRKSNIDYCLFLDINQEKQESINELKGCYVKKEGLVVEEKRVHSKTGCSPITIHSNSKQFQKAKSILERIV